MSSVPVIDFTAFGNGTKQERAELANRITQELTKYGAMRLINHGVTVESKSCSDRFVALRACFQSTHSLLKRTSSQDSETGPGDPSTCRKFLKGVVTNCISTVIKECYAWVSNRSESSKHGKFRNARKGG